MNRIIVIDKPYGLTSSYVANKLKNFLGAKKAGHSGTLDPIATGVLVVFFDDMTKIIPYINEEIKKYEVKILLGLETDTLDIAGKITSLSMKSDYLNTDFNKVISAFIGEYIYQPPIYSAIKVKGVPSYRYAREGRDLELKDKKSTIDKIQIIENGRSTLNLIVTSTKGTYIRALARDIGKSISSFGIVSKLRRLSTGKFSIENSNDFYSILKGNKPDFFDIRRILPSLEINQSISNRLFREKNHKKVDLFSFTGFVPDSSVILLMNNKSPELIARNKFNSKGEYLNSEIKFFSKKN